MPNAARLLDTVDGTTAGEHSGHGPPHPPLPFSGEISGGCSPNVRTNGQPAAIVTIITVAVGSGTVRINGLPAARLGDALAPHSGSGTITGGSPDVRIGG